MTRWTRRAATTTAGVVALVAAVVPVLTRSRAITSELDPAVALARDPPFSIASAVTEAPSCDTPAALYPGVPRCLTYTVHNSLSERITVTSITVLEVAAPPTCPSSNLDLSGATFSGSFDVAPGAQAPSPGRRITLIETGTNQDACQGATFRFTYAGTAISASGAEIAGGGAGEPASSEGERETATDADGRTDASLRARDGDAPVVDGQGRVWAALAVMAAGVVMASAAAAGAIAVVRRVRMRGLS